MINQTDKQIDRWIADTAKGDMESLKMLYEQLRVPVYKFALSIVKSPSTAEDVAQETFMRIRLNAHTYRSRQKARAWIFSIVHNLAVTELRRSARTVNLHEQVSALVSDDCIKVDETSAVTQLLDLLKSDEKQIVSLHVLAGLKHTEIAKALDLPYTQVRWKYAYAIKKLKKHLEKEGNK